MSGLSRALGLLHLPDEEDTADGCPRLDGHAHLEPGVRIFLHVFFPRGIAGKSRLAIAGVTGRRRPALSFASDGKPLDQSAIETDVEQLRPAHAHDVILILPSQANLDHVLAINRKVIANRHAAA